MSDDLHILYAINTPKKLNGIAVEATVGAATRDNVAIVFGAWGSKQGCHQALAMFQSGERVHTRIGQWGTIPATIPKKSTQGTITAIPGTNKASVIIFNKDALTPSRTASRNFVLADVKPFGEPEPYKLIPVYTTPRCLNKLRDCVQASVRVTVKPEWMNWLFETARVQQDLNPNIIGYLREEQRFDTIGQIAKFFPLITEVDSYGCAVLEVKNNEELWEMLISYGLRSGAISLV